MSIHVLHPGEASSLQGDWQPRLQRATSAAEVVAVARDYLAALPAEDVERLPERCRPRALAGPEDITAYAVDLVQHDVGIPEPLAPPLDALSMFFTAASVRLSQIASRYRAPA